MLKRQEKRGIKMKHINQDIQYFLNQTDMKLSTVNATLNLVINDLERLNNQSVLANQEKNEGLQIHFCQTANDKLDNLFLVLMEMKVTLQLINDETSIYARN